MIFEKEVKMVINQYNIDYYKKKLNKELSIGERVFVDVNVLPPTSGVKITTQCEYCGAVFKKPYRRYLESKERGKICCSNCKEKKILENCISKYGTRSTLLIPEIHDKMVQNNLKKYGVPHSTTKESIKKARQTTLQRYGVENVLSSPKIREKINLTLYENGMESGVYTSKQQKHINELLQGELNRPFGPYHVDIFLKEKNIGIEYSGSGHDLSVKLGRVSEKKFQAKERARHSYFINRKIPIIEIFSKKDKLPSDEVIIKEINNAIEYIKSSSSLYYTIDLDNINH